MKTAQRIEWERVIDIDDVTDIAGLAKGVHVLMDGLKCLLDEGPGIWDKEAFSAIQSVMETIITKAEKEALPKVDYTHNKIAEIEERLSKAEK